MKATYINLDAAVGRRADITAQFSAVPTQGWELTRFPAVPASEMVAAPGKLSPAAKACFESHRRVIASSLGDDEPLFVLEDDAALSRMTFPVVNALLKASGDWDILFTEVALFDASVMADLARNFDRLKAEGRFITPKLRGVHFSSAAAYVVRGSAKAKVSRVLNEARSLDVPYDIYLRQRCDAGDLNASACFPFVTTLTAASAASQITPEPPSLHLQAIDAFRRLLFVGRDPAQVRNSVAAIEGQLNDTSRMIGVILGSMAHPT